MLVFDPILYLPLLALRTINLAQLIPHLSQKFVNIIDAK